MGVWTSSECLTLVQFTSYLYGVITIRYLNIRIFQVRWRWRSDLGVHSYFSFLFEFIFSRLSKKDRKFSNKTVIQNWSIAFHSNFLFTLPSQLNICSCNHCVKSVQIRSFFWSVYFCIQTEYREMRTRENCIFGHFQAVYVFFALFTR